ncbi:MAG: hypothetical protein AB7E80_01430 [Hyphomicrobiaceae bacterium]
MMRSLLVALAAVSVAALSAAQPADAGERRTYRGASEGAHPKSSYYRRGPRVKGYVARRGGYSYTAEDAINTYGDSRGRFGSANSLRDPFLDRQTKAGPFDHGFFFDSGIAPRGGDSPYMH